MDALADLLDGVRAHSAAFCRTVLAPPWALRIADGAVLSLATPLHGRTWFLDTDPRTGEPIRLAPGDVCVVTGSRPFTVADDPGTAPDVVVGPGNALTTTDGEPGGLPDVDPTSPGATVLASGTYRISGDVGRRLLDALPRVLVVPAADMPSAVMDLLGAELTEERPGQQLALDRLLDLALITTLRAWFARPEARAPGWYRALGDPVVGTALRRLHSTPTRSWTVAELAHEAGVSRATLARRFRELVGEPPLAYLTSWRLTLAADLLQRTDRTVESIAREVGYTSGFALSAAFTRERGISPRAHRAAHAERLVQADVTTAGA